MRFKGRQLAVETVIGMEPGVVRRVGSAIRRDHGDARGQLAVAAVGSRDLQGQLPHGTQILPFANRDDLVAGARNIHDVDLRIAAAVADVGDAPAISGPARSGGVPIAIGQGQRITVAGACRDPQLVPAAARVRGVNDALAVGRPVGPGAPCGLFLPHQARFGIARQRPAPDRAGAIDDLGVADVGDFLAVGRPAGRELVIEGAVVVAWRVALAFGPCRAALQPAAVKRADEHVEMAGAGGGHPGDALAIG